MKTRHDKPLTPTHGMAGFSIVEMMISITIGLMIVAALVGVLVSNSASTKTNDRTSELQSNGRFALDHLKRELHHAGYRGYTWAEPNTPTGVVPTNECLDGGAAGSFVTNIRQGLWGANDSNPYAANCLSTQYLRGDVLIIRRVASAPATDCTTNPTGASTVYFRSTYAAGEVFQGTTPPGVAGSPCADFAVQEYVYYIGRDDNDATVPALRRVALQPNGSMADEMVVSGIEHLQMQYGSATTDLNTRYYNAGEAPDLTGASTDTAVNGWDNINSVRVWLLARNSKKENGYSNTNSYVMGDQTYTVNDNFRRQLFTAVVQLRN